MRLEQSYTFKLIEKNYLGNFWLILGLEIFENILKFS